MSSIEYINSVVLTASAANVTFSNIPQYYQDLTIVVSSTVISSGFVSLIRLNDDSGSNYSYNVFWATTGTNVYGGSRANNMSSMYLEFYGYPGTSNPNLSKCNIMSYSNPNMFKTAVMQSFSESGVDLMTGVWRSTNAVNSIVIIPGNGGAGREFKSGSTFTLWGVR